jgi:hypothetical protein
MVKAQNHNPTFMQILLETCSPPKSHIFDLNVGTSRLSSSFKEQTCKISTLLIGQFRFWSSFFNYLPFSISFILWFLGVTLLVSLELGPHVFGLEGDMELWIFLYYVL